MMAGAALAQSSNSITAPATETTAVPSSLLSGFSGSQNTAGGNGSAIGKSASDANGSGASSEITSTVTSAPEPIAPPPPPATTITAAATPTGQ